MVRELHRPHLPLCESRRSQSCPGDTVMRSSEVTLMIIAKAPRWSKPSPPASTPRAGPTNAIERERLVLTGTRATSRPTSHTGASDGKPFGPSDCRPTALAHFRFLQRACSDLAVACATPAWTLGRPPSLPRSPQATGPRPARRSPHGDNLTGGAGRISRPGSLRRREYGEGGRLRRLHTATAWRGRRRASASWEHGERGAYPPLAPARRRAGPV